MPDRLIRTSILSMQPELSWRSVMRTKWLAMTTLGGAMLTFASGANAMTNTMPAGLAKSADQVGHVEQARWVCGPFRCWWRPNYYGYYGYYGYRPWWRGHRRWW
jgi:hypothetical protein